ncbi:rhomboid family intramembrane serine protease [Urechidicola vernalis]|uniref:Rhomboid family intramembrane serine protease n=1 Tax=Urechidicola vernalis TaxID=3075600 RepID=A0ABU2Y0Z8_9FLAO|nr:rhomboid family intramembrane serine protease [Urechidicola sp. P050]MDT0551791.1 rhomboid family intramembrane serine protease [Urechidicola sp. P050]
MSQVVLLIIVANVLFSYKGFNDQVFFNKYKFQVGAIRQGDYIRLLSSGFLHVDFNHLIFNMLTLYFFGDNVIAIVGVPYFLIIYFACLLFGGLFSLAYHKNQLYYSAVGASGAVMGIIYAAIMLYPGMKLNFIFFPFVDIPGYVFGLGYLIYSVYGMKKSIGNIGHSAHLGGAIGGYAITIALTPEVLTTNLSLVVILGIPIVLIFLFAKKLNL